jgi:hypothetical protein
MRILTGVMGMILQHAPKGGIADLSNQKAAPFAGSGFSAIAGQWMEFPKLLLKELPALRILPKEKEKIIGFPSLSCCGKA